jgi:hypothetical protein
VPPVFALPYFQSNCSPSPAFPNRRTTPRPLISVNLINGPFSIGCFALLDTGADDCIFPALFAEQLGLNYLTGRRYPFGAASAGIQYAYFFDLELEILGLPKYKLPVGFSPGLDQSGQPLLGQHGFFDRFSVNFDLPNNVFAVSIPGPTSSPNVPTP